MDVIDLVSSDDEDDFMVVAPGEVIDLTMEEDEEREVAPSPKCCRKTDADGHALTCPICLEPFSGRMVYLQHGDRPGHCVHLGEDGGECGGWLQWMITCLTPPADNPHQVMGPPRCPACNEVPSNWHNPDIIDCGALSGGMNLESIKAQILRIEGGAHHRRLGMRRWLNQMITHDV